MRGAALGLQHAQGRALRVTDFAAYLRVSHQRGT